MSVRLFRLPAALVLVAVMSSGCFLIDRADSSDSYQQSARKIKGLIDPVLADALPGRPFPVKPTAQMYLCEQGSLGLPENHVRFDYGYQFSSEALGDNPERLVSIANKFWRKRGFSVDPDVTSDSVGSFAVNDEGAGLQVSVSRQDNNVVLGGSGPCVKRPKGMR